MKKTTRLFGCMVIYLVLGMFLAVGAFQTPAVASNDKPIKWRLQSTLSSQSLIYYGLVKDFCKHIKERSNGRLEIKAYPPGGLAKTRETFDVVSAGAVEMALSAGLYYGRKIPVGNVEFGLPFSFSGTPFTFEAAAQAYEFYYEYKGGEPLKILRDAYDKKGIYYLNPVVSSSYGAMVNFPVQSLADFKGKKIRAFGFFGTLIQEMGASAVSIPSAEQYLALQRGTVDGTIYPYHAVETFNLKEVIKYVVMPPFVAAPACNFYINKKAWQKLPEDLKKLVRETALEDTKRFTKQAVALDQKAIKAGEKVGVKVATLPDRDVAKLRGLSVVVWDKEAKKSESSARLIGLLKEYLTEKGVMK